MRLGCFFLVLCSRTMFRRCRSQYSLPIMPLCTIPAFFDVSTNILTGAMPAELGDLPELRELHMNHGFSLSLVIIIPFFLFLFLPWLLVFACSIRSCFLLLTLRHSWNQSINPSFNHLIVLHSLVLCMLVFLVLNNNQLSGQIPPEIGNAQTISKSETGGSHICTPTTRQSRQHASPSSTSHNLICLPFFLCFSSLFGFGKQRLHRNDSPGVVRSRRHHLTSSWPERLWPIAHSRRDIFDGNTTRAGVVCLQH